MIDIMFGNNHDYCLSDILEILLLKIGLTNEDVVKINDINYFRNKDEDKHDYVVEFSINDVNLYKFIFRYDDVWDPKPMFIFVKDNESFGYNMDIDDMYKKVIDLRGSFYEIETDYGIYRRDYSYMRACYMVKWGFYSLYLELYKPHGYVNSKNDFRYKLDNEDGLRDYLCSLEFPLRIDEVYKKICRDYLGDISKYPNMHLEVRTFDHINACDVVTDKIIMHNGEWMTFGMTKGNKIIMLDKSGDWSYKLLDCNLDFKLSMNINEDEVSYSIKGKSKEELDKYFNQFVKDDIENANSYVDETKKLVKIMFERDGKNYDR